MTMESLVETQSMRMYRPDSPDLDLAEQLQALRGEEMPIDQDAVLEPDEFEQRREPTRTELDHGAHKPDLEVVGGQPATLDGLAREDLRTGETDDAVAATEEGLAYVPPVEPTAAFREPADRRAADRQADPAPREPSDR